MYYDTGRTLAALNKVDAALKLSALEHGKEQASRRLADWLQQNVLRGTAMSKPRYRQALQRAGALAQLLELAAHGPFPLNQNTGRTEHAAAFQHALFMNLTHVTREATRKICTDECARIEVAACLWLFEFLDPYMHRGGRRFGFDSIQLLQSPQGGYSFFASPRERRGTLTRNL